MVASPDEPGSALLRLVRDEARRAPRLVGIAVAAMAAMAACAAGAALLVGAVVDDVLITRDPGAVAGLLVIFGALALSYAVASFVESLFTARLVAAALARGRVRLFAAMLRYDMSVVAGPERAELADRYQIGAAAASSALDRLAAFLRDGLLLAALALVLLAKDAQLGLVAILTMLAVVAGEFVAKARRRRSPARRSARPRRAEVGRTLRQALQGIRTVRAFRLDEAFLARMQHAAIAERIEAGRAALTQARLRPALILAGAFAIAAVVWHAGGRVVDGMASPGDFSSVVAALGLAYAPARRLRRLASGLEAAKAGLSLEHALRHDVPAEPERPGKPALRLTEGVIVFDGVASAPALSGFSLRLAPGKATALVAEASDGASLIVPLLLRFRIPDEGGILIDGQELRSVSATSLREAIAVVGHDDFIFRGSVRENIAIGRADASDEAILAAAVAAEADGFIRALPDGYDTQIGGSASLPDGQRLRIAIARAILKDAPIVVLDEPGTGSNAEENRAIHAALRALAAGRTTLIIARRLDTVRDADAIHVMAEGRIVESGTHMALLAAGGRYRALYQVMSRDPRDPD